MEKIDDIVSAYRDELEDELAKAKIHGKDVRDVARHIAEAAALVHLDALAGLETTQAEQHIHSAMSQLSSAVRIRVAGALKRSWLALQNRARDAAFLVIDRALG